MNNNEMSYQIGDRVEFLPSHVFCSVVEYQNTGIFDCYLVENDDYQFWAMDFELKKVGS